MRATKTMVTFLTAVMLTLFCAFAPQAFASTDVTATSITVSPETLNIGDDTEVTAVYKNANLTEEEKVNTTCQSVLFALTLPTEFPAEFSSYTMKNSANENVPGEFTTSNGRLVFTASQTAIDNMQFAGEQYTLKATLKLPKDIETLKNYADGSVVTLPYNIASEMNADFEVKVTDTETGAESTDNKHVESSTSKNGNITMRTPSLNITKTVKNNITKTNIGSTQGYILTINNSNTGTEAKGIVITDKTNLSALGVTIDTSSVTVKKNGTNITSSCSITPNDGGIAISLNNNTIGSSDTVVVEYNIIVGNSANYMALAEQTSGIINTAKVTSTNCLNSVSRSASTINLLVPTVVATSDGGKSELTTGEETTVNVYFALNGDSGTELLSPKVTISGFDAKGTDAKISDVTVKVGNNEPVNVEGLEYNIPSRLIAGTNPAVVLQYKLTAPSDSDALNGNINITSQLSGSNMTVSQQSKSNFTTTVSVPKIEKTFELIKTPDREVTSASGAAMTEEPPSFPLNPSIITPKATIIQTAKGGKLESPVITFTSDAPENVVWSKFVNIKAYLGDSPLSAIITDGEDKPEESQFDDVDVIAVRNGDKMTVYTSKNVVLGDTEANNKLVVSYEEYLGSGYEPNNQSYNISADVEAINLLNKEHIGDGVVKVEAPSLTLATKIVDPVDDKGMPQVINFRDSVKYETKFFADKDGALGQDFSVEIAALDLVDGDKTFTASELGLSFADDIKITIKNGEEEVDVSDQYTIELDETKTKIIIKPKNITETVPTQETVIHYVLNTNAKGQYADQIRGSEAGVTAKLIVSNLKDPLVNEKVNVTIANAHLLLKKTSSGKEVKPTEKMDYLISVENDFDDASSKAQGIVIEDALDKMAVKFGYTIDHSSLKVMLGEDDLTNSSNIKIDWKSDGFIIEMLTDLPVSKKLEITYTAITDNIAVGSYSQNLSNVVIATSDNAAPAVAAATVKYVGVDIEEDPREKAGSITDSNTEDQSKTVTQQNKFSNAGNNSKPAGSSGAMSKAGESSAPVVFGLIAVVAVLIAVAYTIARKK